MDLPDSTQMPVRLSSEPGLAHVISRRLSSVVGVIGDHVPVVRIGLEIGDLYDPGLKQLSNEDKGAQDWIDNDQVADIRIALEPQVLEVLESD